MGFQKAVKAQTFLKVALTGPSGAGKTFSALAIARGLVGKAGKIALIDTEARSASLYADRYAFDTLNIDPPYTVDKYLSAIDEAVRAGYAALIVDSASHQWSGDGGALDKKSSMDSRGGNSYTNWSPITKEHNAFRDRILNAPVHMICTMRSKTEYVLETNDKGKQVPRKVGLAPVQRDGMEYEFTSVIDLALDHSGVASKDRTGLFSTTEPFKVGEETGRMLADWQKDAAPQPAPNAEPKPAPKKAAKAAAPDAPEQNKPEPVGFSEGQMTAYVEVIRALPDMDALKKYWGDNYKTFQGTATEEQMLELTAAKDNKKTELENA